MQPVPSQFEVQVVSPQAQQYGRVGNKYISLPSGSTYSLHLINNGNTRAEATVTIDNVAVGTWRIPARDSIIIDRPENSDSKFTFVGGRLRSENNSLINIIFKPARQNLPTYPRLITNSPPPSRPMSMRSVQQLSSRVTVLDHVPSLRDDEVDWQGVVEVNVRLTGLID